LLEGKSLGALRKSGKGSAALGFAVDHYTSGGPVSGGTAQGEHGRGHGWLHRLGSFGFNGPETRIRLRYQKVYLQALLVSKVVQLLSLSSIDPLSQRQEAAITTPGRAPDSPSSRPSCT